MSWYRRIKVLSAFTFAVFIYIIWMTFVANSKNVLCLFTVVGAVFLMQFLKQKTFNKHLVLIFPMLFSAITVSFLIHKNVFIDIIYLSFSLFLFANIDDDIINYNTYVDRIKIGLLILIASGILAYCIGNMNSYMSKFYLLILVLAVLLLRNVRRYCTNIKNSRSKYGDIAVVIFILITSIDKLFMIVINLFKTILDLFNETIGTAILKFLIIIFGPLFNYLYNLIRNKTNVIFKNQQNKTLMNEEVFKKIDYSKGGEPPLWLVYFFQGILLLFIAFIFYQLYKKYSLSRQKNEEDLIEETREKIDKKTSKRKGIFSSILDSFYRGSDVKLNILYVFKKFEKKTYDKGIFKKFMSARQLSNITKTHIQSANELDAIAEIYNEAKFSKHEMEREKLEAIKDNYSKVKKEL